MLEFYAGYNAKYTEDFKIQSIFMIFMYRFAVYLFYSFGILVS